MNPFEMVVALVALGTFGSVLKARYSAMGGRERAGPDPDSVRAREEMRALKERIQVLERVITDNHDSHDLGTEIERLRDR